MASSEKREVPGVGGLIQTLALGPQDTHLYDLDDAPSCNPFTTPPSKRPTRGALEVKDQVFSPFLFDTINRVEIQRQGDLLGDVMLQIGLPVIPGATQNDYWRPNVGYILIKHIRLMLNDTELNSNERLYYDLYEQLYETDSTRRAIREMIGGEQANSLRLTREHVIIVPLKLFTSKRRGSSQTFMPMLATPGSSLYLEIETDSFLNCVTSYGGNAPPRSLDCTLLVEYVFIEGEEKERIINAPQTLLIETVQDAEGFSYREVNSQDGQAQLIPTQHVTVSLKEINFPAKAIVFAAYSTSDLQNRVYFQYQDVIESVSLRFNGNDRTEGQEPIDYYRLIQPYMHAPRCTGDNVFFYSFALQPRLLQPTGVFSFSNIREADLFITLKQPRDDIVVKAFVIGYSWVNFSHGFATTLFA